MATTYQLIAAVNLTGTSTAVAFSSIPQTFTDLVLKSSVRLDTAATRTNIRASFNSTPAIDETYLVGYAPSNYLSSSNTGNTFFYWEYINGDQATANTFGYGEFYLSNYASTTQTKVGALQSASESNSNTTPGHYLKRVYINATAAVTSITLGPSSGNMMAGSSFYLYGISKS